MTETARPRPVVLCILDGWGHREAAENNAIHLARIPVLDRFFATCPHALIDASAQEVGLPAEQMGNSEVGHMNLGAGRVVMQDLPRIDRAVDGFARPRVVRFAAAAGMVEYSSALKAFLDALFEPLDLRHTLGEEAAEAGLRQLRIAETEKYAHVTFFLNGGREAEFEGEERILVPSPKSRPTTCNRKCPRRTRNRDRRAQGRAGRRALRWQGRVRRRISKLRANLDHRARRAISYAGNSGIGSCPC